MKIEQGQIWKVETPMIVNYDPIGKSEIGKRKILLEKGEMIEIRYPFAWHFRTEDNVYFQADEVNILKNCSFFGTIKDDICSMNRHSLKQILEMELFVK